MTQSLAHPTAPAPRFGRTGAAALVTVLLIAAAATNVQSAVRPCGDADGDAAVSVADGVNVLRSAANLSSIATRDCCDMDFNGVLSVADGVLALRAAADLPSDATCIDEQVQDGLARFGPITKLSGSLSAGSQSIARVAETQACPGGGFSIVEADRLEDVECRNGDVVTTGLITLSEEPLSATFASFQAINLDTAETLLSSGTIAFRDEVDGTVAAGTVTRTSSAPPPSRNGRGDFRDELRDVTIDADGTIVSGSLLTTVTAGRGIFASLRTIETFFVASTLSIAVVNFSTADQQVGIIAADKLGLCRACQSTNECEAPLICLPCTTDCVGSGVERCTVNFQNFAARCEDGLY